MSVSVILSQSYYSLFSLLSLNLESQNLAFLPSILDLKNKILVSPHLISFIRICIYVISYIMYMYTEVRGLNTEAMNE